MTQEMAPSADRDTPEPTKAPGWDNRTAGMVERVPAGLRGGVAEVGGVGQLLVRLVSTAIRNPRGYWRNVGVEMFNMIRFTWLPTVFAVGGFCFEIGNYAYNMLGTLGAQDRLGVFFVFATAREISPFATGMAVAGVMGTALCADLGARRIREELDALHVLGVDVVRELVLPRVIAIAVMTVAFNILGIALGVMAAGVSATIVGDTSAGAYVGNFLINMTTPELIGTVVKTFLIGLFIGVVCAQKGLAAKGGAEGVGRAVNQAVVLCFAAVWIFNFIVNAVMLGSNPDMLVNR